MNNNRWGYIEGINSIFFNILLFFLKYWAGIVSGSIALVTDAWHTLSDSFSSIILIIGIKLSSKAPDKKHTFGHGRWEQVTAIFIGFFLGIIAFEFSKESIEKFLSGKSAHFGTIAITVTITSILIKEGLAQFAFYIAKKTNNTAIKADGWHHRTDSLSSLIVLIGIFFKDSFWWIDSILGIAISLMIFYAAFEIVKDSVSKLLGEAPSEELINKIRQIISKKRYESLLPHHFHIHDYGSHKELTFHIKFDGKTDINTAHSIATAIENEIRNNLNIEPTIHIEPFIDDNHS
jgi:cation diffusion facilitator family transporter